MGNKPKQNSRAFYLSEISRSLLVWGTDILPKVKHNLFFLNLHTTKKACLDCGGSIFLTRVCNPIAYIKYLRKLLALNGTERGKDPSTGLNCCATWTLCSRRPDGTWGVHVRKRCCLETLALTYRQITMKTLEVWEQSSAIIHRQLFLFKGQHLVYYWALARKWPSNCQATWAAYIIIWVLSNPTLSHKLHSSNLLSNGSDRYVIRLEQVLTTQPSYRMNLS